MHWRSNQLEEYFITGEIFSVKIRFNMFSQNWEVCFNNNVSTLCCYGGLSEAKTVAEEMIKKRLTRDYCRFIGVDDV